MPIFTVPVHESNDCHEPGGQPIGGRFCSDGTSVSAADRSTFDQIRAKWATINNALLSYMDRPDSPEALALADQQKALVKQMYGLHVDPGGVEGLGLPGGPRDLVVVGAGPGGLSTAINAGLDGLDTLFIDASPTTGGQPKASSRIENLAGFPVGITGDKLAKDMFEQVQRVGAEGKLGVRVTALDYDPKTEIKTLTLSDGTTVQARSVVIAGGVEIRTMNFPGSDAKNIVYQDGAQVAAACKGSSAVIVGGSNGAAQAALGVARTAGEVTLLSRSPLEKGMSLYQIAQVRNNPKIKIIEGDEIASLTKDADGYPKTLITKGGRQINTRAVGMFLGSLPSTSWLKGIETAKGGKVVTNDKFETNMPGVYAVGDIRNGAMSRIGASVGEGQIAEHFAYEYLYRKPTKK